MGPSEFRNREMVIPRAHPYQNWLAAARFFARYEQLYGKSSSFRGAWLEMVTFRVRASAATPQEEWWTAGIAPVLDLQGAQDPWRPRETEDP